MGIKSKTNIMLDNNKIYSSYFAYAGKVYPNKRLVSIALTTPDNWGGAYLRELNPTPMLIHNIKNNIITPAEYENEYRDIILSRLNPLEIVDKAKGKILCCWEKSEEFCHRHIVLNWLQEQLGKEIIGGEV